MLMAHIARTMVKSLFRALLVLVFLYLLLLPLAYVYLRVQYPGRLIRGCPVSPRALNDNGRFVTLAFKDDLSIIPKGLAACMQETTFIYRWMDNKITGHQFMLQDLVIEGYPRSFNYNLEADPFQHSVQDRKVPWY